MKTEAIENFFLDFVHAELAVRQKENEQETDDLPIDNFQNFIIEDLKSVFVLKKSRSMFSKAIENVPDFRPRRILEIRIMGENAFVSTTRFNPFENSGLFNLFVINEMNGVLKIVSMFFWSNRADDIDHEFLFQGGEKNMLTQKETPFGIFEMLEEKIKDQLNLNLL